MKLDTRSFGIIEVAEDKVIFFEEGLPGFENLHRFVLIDSEEGIFHYLQSIDATDVCFVIADPYHFQKEYAPIINEGYFEKLGGGMDEEFAVFSVVCLREPIDDSTINLAGPILIQTECRKGIQVITEDKKYSARHKFLEAVDGGK